MKTPHLQVVLLVVLSVLASASAQAPDSLGLANLRCEYSSNPLGIDAPQPRLSWELTSQLRDTHQSAYRILVLADGPTGPQVWDSGRRESDESTQVAYEGPALKSRGAYAWQVQVWDNHGRQSAWSAPATWEMGLLAPSDWKASWIVFPRDGGGVEMRGHSPLFRREFTVTKPVVSARLYATAQGLYQMELNGEVVGPYCLTPGWTSYDSRYQYQVYDVTRQVARGANCLGAQIGDGWFCGSLTWSKQEDNYGRRPALLSQLVLTYADGTHECIATGKDWKTAPGPIVFSSIYDGETYDARLESPGWSRPGFDDSAWRLVDTAAAPAAALEASGPVCRRQEEIRPVRSFRTPSGQVVLDMGQNMVGWMRFRVTAPVGQVITLRHAEILDKDGNVYFENLRKAAQTVRYTVRGGGAQTFEPHFTFMGFRYVVLEGWPGEPQLDDFRGVVVHSDLARTGEFECSDPLINQLQHNIIWGQKGNFVDIPSDCPQRDERLGWTGDTQVFSPTACFNFDCAGFYTKWLRDLALDQRPDGSVPWVIPDVLGHASHEGSSGAAGWADSSVVVPWVVYRAYGDVRVLERQYASMRAWVEYMRREAGERCIWNTGAQFCDWLSYATVDPSYPGATTDKDLIQTAYFAHSTDLLHRAALVLGRKVDADDYGALLARIKAAFQAEFVTAQGRITSNTQTAYALALAFDLLPEALRPEAARRLAQDVRKFGHLTTGFLGTPVLCQVLSDNGYLSEAYMLLERREYPSWLYSVTHGATTIWERWDGLKPDGTFQDVGMNSFNHYAYGAVGNWLYQTVAGIRPDPGSPGYRHFIVAPQPGGGLTEARAGFKGMYGLIRSEWRIKAGTLELTVEVPANSSALVRLPQAHLDRVTEGGIPLNSCAGVSAPHQDGAQVVADLASGTYAFSYPVEQGP